MAIPFALLGAVASTGFSLASGFLNKPKKSDYEVKANTKGMDKYIGYLKGKSLGNEAYEMAMRPQQRAIGRQVAKSRRDIQGYMAGQGMEGSGAAAQARLSLQQQAADQLTDVHEQAISQQMQERRQMGQDIAKTQAERTQAIEDARLRSEQAYTQARQGWKQQMTQTAFQGLGNIASAGLNTLATNQANLQAGYQAALESGAIDPSTTMSDFKTQYQGSGMDSPQSFAASTGKQVSNQSILAQSHQYLGEDKTSQLMNAGYTFQDLQTEINAARQVDQAAVLAGIKKGDYTADNLATYWDSMNPEGVVDDVTAGEQDTIDTALTSGTAGILPTAGIDPNISTRTAGTSISSEADLEGGINWDERARFKGYEAGLPTPSATEPAQVGSVAGTQIPTGSVSEEDVRISNLRKGLGGGPKVSLGGPTSLNEQIELNKALQQGKDMRTTEADDAQLAQIEQDAAKEKALLTGSSVYDPQYADSTEQPTPESIELARLAEEQAIVDQGKLKLDEALKTGETVADEETLAALEEDQKLIEGSTFADDPRAAALEPGEHSFLEESIGEPEEFTWKEKMTNLLEYRRAEKAYKKNEQAAKRSSTLIKEVREKLKDLHPLGEGWDEDELDIETIEVPAFETISLPNWDVDTEIQSLEDKIKNIPNNERIAERKSLMKKLAGLMLSKGMDRA